MPTKKVDLLKLFTAVSQTLKENQASLNETDAYNHDHGDNMVKNFKVITKALKEKKGAPPAEQLEYASQVLSHNSASGSAQMYVQGLAQAANQLAGQKAITAENALSLVQALLGGQPGAQPAQPAASDLMGQMIGSLLGGSGASGQPEQPAQTQPADMLGELMGTLLGGQSSTTPGSQTAAQQPDLLGGLVGTLLGGGASTPPAQATPAGQGAGGFDLNTLLTAGMAYLQASQQGAEPIEALTQAALAGSQMSATPHHAQSGQLVASTLISTLGTLLGGKKK